MGDISEKVRLLISDLNSKADRLDVLHLNVNKVHVVGNSASAVGSAAALVGILAAPLTGGASLAMTLGSFAGGIASGGASIHQHISEISIMVAMCGRVKSLVDDIVSEPDLKFKYGKLVMSLGGVLRKIGKVYSACQSYSSGEEFKPPGWEREIKIFLKESSKNGVLITVTGKEVSKVSFLVTGKEAAKVLADTTGKEAVKLVEKYTGEVALKASVQFAGKGTAKVSGEVISKVTAKGSQATSAGAKALGVGMALFSLGWSAYSTAKAVDQIVNDRKSEGGAYLRQLVSVLEEIII